MKLKEYHYTEAAANINKGDAAHRQISGSGEEEPIPLALGKSEIHSSTPVCQEERIADSRQSFYI